MKHWMLVDSNYLCYRAFHTTGGLSHNGVSTGVAFGFLRAVEQISDLLSPDRVVFAFDGGAGLRNQVSPAYKSSRKEMTDEEREARVLLYGEIDALRARILPSLGYKNVICVRGYEADDVIAQVAENLPIGVEATVVSADGDLLQCISEKVSVYNPASKKMTTFAKFKEEWGILPSMWASVKALAGCSTDDVVGIYGVGEATAAKWFSGKLKPDSKGYKLISENLDVFAKNIELVKLPYPGLTLPELRDDESTREKWMKVRTDLGIRSKRGHSQGGLDVRSAKNDGARS